MNKFWLNNKVNTKSLFKYYNSTFKGICFSYTALYFFAVAAGYVCKIRLV